MLAHQLTAVKKVSMEKIYEAYKKRNEHVDFQIMFRDIVVDRSDTVKPFIEPNDNMVLFMARRSGSGSDTVELRPSASVKDEPMKDVHTGFAMSMPAPVTPAKSSTVYRPEDAILHQVTAYGGTRIPSSPCRARSSARPTTPILAFKEHDVSPPWDSLRDVVRPSLHPVTTPPLASEALIGRLLTSLTHGKEPCSAAATNSKASDAHMSTERDTVPVNPSPYVRTHKVTPVPLPTRTPKVETPVPMPTKTSKLSAHTPTPIPQVTPKTIPAPLPPASPAAVKYERPATPVFHHIEEGSQTAFNPEEVFN